MKKRKKQGRFTRIDELEWTEGKPKQAWTKGLDFPVLFHRQVFTNKDGSTGILNLQPNLYEPKAIIFSCPFMLLFNWSV